MKQFILERSGMQPVIIDTFSKAAGTAVDHVVGDGYRATVVCEGEEILSVREGTDDKVRITTTMVVPNCFEVGDRLEVCDPHTSCQG
jgi:hypothetical protein